MPSDDWFTIETAHFRVHYSPPLEAEARRAALDAERAWRELSTELKAPRGKVDLVIADNVDYVNGYATPFPSNRIVVFAHPPVNSTELRNYSDWSRLVITHELVHVFHLDRADGVWRIGRKLLGRHPALFPNAYLPSWVAEGLAVYYESRVTGAGRLEGAEHYMIARAAAEARLLPRLGELSRQTTRFPGGEVVYAYGGQIFDYLSRTRGPGAIPRFVDVTSGVLLPLSLNRKSKRAFGISFENAFRDWSDSLVRVSRRAPPLSGWHQLTDEGRSIAFPRWLGDTALIYAAATGREVPGVYLVQPGGEPLRLGRRNNLDANVVRPDGAIVFAQGDFIDAFHYRTDLYVEKDGDTRRLTRGARLSQPDVRGDGEIVAVQAHPGTTNLVLVSPDGRAIRPFTVAEGEVQWTEPRWSPDGRRIAAVRIRGDTSDLVILDRDKEGPVAVVVSEHSILASPSWHPSGTRLTFTSNRTGVPQAWAVDMASGLRTQLSSTSTGFFGPEYSPRGDMLAGLDFRADGFHLGVAPAPAGLVAPEGVVRRARAGCSDCLLATNDVAPFGSDSVTPPRRYSAWRSILPTFWQPLASQSSGDGWSLGAATAGSDIIGRHSYYLEAQHSFDRAQTEGVIEYSYGGFGQPVANLFVSQDFERFDIFTGSGRIGFLSRRERTAGLSATLFRPRARTAASLLMGGDIERRTYYASPDTLLALLPPTFASTRNYPSLFASAAWANTRRPALSISREDGVSLGLTLRQRWEEWELSRGSSSAIGTIAFYKALDLPGFAHHVIAVRGAAAVADHRAISTFSVGGLSGGSLEVLSGVAVGSGRRTFGVRGFPPSAQQGTRAYGGTAEYRLPLAAPSRRWPYIPVFFDRVSFSAFGEAGRAECPPRAETVCPESEQEAPWLASTGGELDLDTALQYDFPARFRLGIAIPVHGRASAGARKASFYFTVGSSF